MNHPITLFPNDIQNKQVDLRITKYIHAAKGVLEAIRGRVCYVKGQTLFEKNAQDQKAIEINIMAKNVVQDIEKATDQETSTFTHSRYTPEEWNDVETQYNQVITERLFQWSHQVFEPENGAKQSQKALFQPALLSSDQTPDQNQPISIHWPDEIREEIEKAKRLAWPKEMKTKEKRYMEIQKQAVAKEDIFDTETFADNVEKTNDGISLRDMAELGIIRYIRNQNPNTPLTLLPDASMDVIHCKTDGKNIECIAVHQFFHLEYAGKEAVSAQDIFTLYGALIAGAAPLKGAPCQRKYYIVVTNDDVFDAFCKMPAYGLNLDLRILLLQNMRITKEKNLNGGNLI